MVTINFNNFPDDNKVLFLLGLSEKVLSVFSQTEDRSAAQYVIEQCWEWLEEKDNRGGTLYDLLDNEENGITIIQEMAADEVEATAWNCIIDAAAYTSRKAFDREGAMYYPEPIALVDDTLVNHFIECFKRIIVDAPLYIQQIVSMLDEYPNPKMISDRRNKILTELHILD
ncbi:Imm6 family immunity protein [Lysinibacillus sp. 3P01SB]|uniref:Imm6 family immunity protein n=1 Tax=Lysinibacillus sp. 3P01SB TaxID=3132284 RepID=UPI0039A595C4